MCSILQLKVWSPSIAFSNSSVPSVREVPLPNKAMAESKYLSWCTTERELAITACPTSFYRRILRPGSTDSIAFAVFVNKNPKHRCRMLLPLVHLRNNRTESEHALRHINPDSHCKIVALHYHPPYRKSITRSKQPFNLYTVIDCGVVTVELNALRAVLRVPTRLGLRRSEAGSVVRFWRLVHWNAVTNQ